MNLQWNSFQALSKRGVQEKLLRLLKNDRAKFDLEIKYARKSCSMSKFFNRRNILKSKPLEFGYKQNLFWSMLNVQNTTGSLQFYILIKIHSLSIYNSSCWRIRKDYSDHRQKVEFISEKQRSLWNIPLLTDLHRWKWWAKITSDFSRRFKKFKNIQ